MQPRQLFPSSRFIFPSSSSRLVEEATHIERLRSTLTPDQFARAEQLARTTPLSLTDTIEKVRRG